MSFDEFLKRFGFQIGLVISMFGKRKRLTEHDEHRHSDCAGFASVNGKRMALLMTRCFPYRLGGNLFYQPVKNRDEGMYISRYPENEEIIIVKLGPDNGKEVIKSWTYLDYFQDMLEQYEHLTIFRCVDDRGKERFTGNNPLSVRWVFRGMQRKVNRPLKLFKKEPRPDEWKEMTESDIKFIEYA